MHVPGLLERVRITGLDEVYLVIGVNEGEQLADLLPIVYGRRPVPSVPFTFMEAIQGCSPPHPEPEEQTSPDCTVQHVRAMEFTDKTLKCVDCGEHFVFSAGEQAFFSEKQFQHEPKHCKRCKAKVYSRRARAESTVTCAACGTSTIVPFVPSQDRPVLCRECLHQQRHDQSACVGSA
jgi:CxxC-x17-CxxC domain-containing protein